MTSTGTPPDEAVRGPRGPLGLALLAAFALLLFAGFVALGTWQVKRLAWKRDLIERVDQRVHAPPAAAPGPGQWGQVTAEADEYLDVSLSGAFLHDRQTLVWAATDLGSGYWVVTPLQMADGAIVLVNRGFVPTDWCALRGQCAAGPSGEVTVTGLLRMSEPSVMLRRNDPTQNRWYTRDVPAIADARGLRRVAPYFVDADAATSPAAGGQRSWPVGGLTVINFPNNHLVYLITWYLLALMVAAAAIFVGREEFRLRRQSQTDECERRS
ncbi:SURF1 family protein [Dyella sp. Tek66A03]|uniref:SURF1 family protein n=1 Tax=Dyella sp. Tek66A03 TaxID=3458298 RepID=UPI00403E3C59